MLQRQPAKLQWTKSCSFLCVQTKRVCQQVFGDFLKMTLTRVTSHLIWLESSHLIKNVTRVESSQETAGRDSSRVRVTKNRDSSRVIDSSHDITDMWNGWSLKIWSLLRSLLFKFIFKISNISGDHKMVSRNPYIKRSWFIFRKELIVNECYLLTMFIFRSLRRRLRIIVLLIISTAFATGPSVLMYSVNPLII